MHFCGGYLQQSWKSIAAGKITDILELSQRTA